MSNKLIEKIQRLAAEGKDAVLVYIKDSKGSTPRGEGACMLVNADGRAAGTVGGGALEHACEKIAAEALSTRTDLAHAFRLNAKDMQNLGMICGGDVDVDFLFINSDDPQSVQRALETAAGQARGRVYIFGGGHVAQALVPALAAVDFDCIVLEDRPDFADPALFPHAADVRQIDNSRVLEEVDIQPDDRVVIMTRGHQNDLEIQAQVMRSPARYIGVIGSQAKTAALTKRLHEMGFTDEDFANVYAPIGIPIRSETPAEIAVSIAAQLILERAGGLKHESGAEA